MCLGKIVVGADDDAVYLCGADPFGEELGSSGYGTYIQPLLEVRALPSWPALSNGWSLSSDTFKSASQKARSLLLAKRNIDVGMRGDRFHLIRAWCSLCARFSKSFRFFHFVGYFAVCDSGIT